MWNLASEKENVCYTLACSLQFAQLGKSLSLSMYSFCVMDFVYLCVYVCRRILFHHTYTRKYTTFQLINLFIFFQSFNIYKFLNIYYSLNKNSSLLYHKHLLKQSFCRITILHFALMEMHSHDFYVCVFVLWVYIIVVYICPAAVSFDNHVWLPLSLSSFHRFNVRLVVIVVVSSFNSLLFMWLKEMLSRLRDIKKRRSINSCGHIGNIDFILHTLLLFVLSVISTILLIIATYILQTKLFSQISLLLLFVSFVVLFSCESMRIEFHTKVHPFLKGNIDCNSFKPVHNLIRNINK